MTHPNEKPERNKKIYDAWKSGKSYNELAREYKMSVQNVARILKNAKTRFGSSGKDR